jgi:enamine deaminase RidA (YjgF/YER057c/UK114 family)
MPKQFLSPPTLPPTKGWSQAVVAPAGRTVYVSGQISLNEKGELVGKGDMAAQAEQTFKNVAAALAVAGASFKDVVKLTVYVVDLKPEYVAAVREVRSRYLNMDQPPASTMVGISALAVPDWMIEVEAVATLSE